MARSKDARTSVSELRAQVAAQDARILKVQAAIDGIDSEKASWIIADLNNPSELRKISDQKLRHDLLPAQLNELLDQRKALIESLKALLSDLGQEIVRLREQERDALIARITGELGKYCVGDPEAGRRAASTLPIVSSIGAASSWETRISGVDRAVNPKSYDSEILNHSVELLEILERFDSNDRSFLSASFKNAA